MVLSLTPYDLPFPQMGVPYAPRYTNGHISAAGDPIHFMFGSRVGFSGTADLMALFSVRTNSRLRPLPSWVISNDHISATAYTTYLYSAHRAAIFAIAQLSCSYCNLRQGTHTLRIVFKDIYWYFYRTFTVILWNMFYSETFIDNDIT